MKNIFFRTPFLAIIMLVCMSCSDSDKNDNGETLVKIGNTTLTRAELNNHLPSGLSKDDSIRFARAFINDWINEQLITSVAANTIDMNMINEMVEEYRKQLIISEYKRRKEAELISSAIPEDSLKAYYDSHQSEFKLPTPLVKGIYVKIDSADVRRKDIVNLLKSPSNSDLDRLEQNYSGALIHYDFFRNRWIDWDKLDALIPFPAEFNPATQIRKGNTTIIDNNGFTYLLHVSDFIPAGDQSPFELVKDEVTRAIAQDQAIDIYARIIGNLYDEGVKNGKVEIFCDINR